jgi:hypothetical protein
MGAIVSAHLWKAALEKAESLRMGIDRRGMGPGDRGQLGLNMHDWCDVLWMAIQARRIRWMAVVAGMLIGFLLGRQMSGVVIDLTARCTP